MDEVQPTGRKARILFVCNSLAGGGAERVFSSILAASAERRNNRDLHVALLDDEPRAYSLPNWVRVHQLNCRRGLVSSIVRLSSLISSLRADLALSFLTRANVATAVGMSLRRRPFIISERVNTSAHLGNGRASLLSKAVVRLCYPRASHAIAVSAGVRDNLATHFGLARDRISVINNPVDVEAIRSLAEQEPSLPVEAGDVVAMGRLTPQKNLQLAIRAFARSQWTGRLVILGDGPLADDLRRLGAELGISNRLVLAGFQPNPYAVVSRASAFLLTSDYEGFCNSLLEALALGTPVISTDCPFSPAEILDATLSPQPGQFAPGRGGLLIRRGDEEALVSALDFLRSEPERRRISLEGQQRARSFDQSDAADRYWQVIETTLQQTRRSEPVAAGRRRSSSSLPVQP
jgi:glycosyltransferase involved in cell wall biosynthesis